MECFGLIFFIYPVIVFSGEWTWQYPVPQANYLYSVWGSSESDVYAVGYYGDGNGAILHYDGKIWSPITSGTTKSLYGIWGSSGSNIFSVGETGTILHFDGSTWSSMESGTDIDLIGVWGSSAKNVFVAGYDERSYTGIILHYNGRNWVTMKKNEENSYI